MTAAKKRRRTDRKRDLKVVTKPGRAEVMRIDIRERECGSYFGGKVGRSVACGVCGKPAARMPTLRSGAERWAHVLHFAINPKNDPEQSFLELCSTGPANTNAEKK